MDDTPTPQPAPAPAPAQEPAVQLEYKPEVKIAAAVLLLLAWVGVCYVFYRLGRQSGYEAGLSSELVAKRVNDQAVQNIAYFLQIASADDDTLLHTVLHHKEQLAWVKDPEVKREALGLLINVLMERGLTRQVETTLGEVLPPAPASAAWTTRMLRAARNLTLSGDRDEARKWYGLAEEHFLAAGLQEQWQMTLREQAALLSMGCTDSAEVRLTGLQELLKRQQEHAPEAKTLHAELQMLLGRVLREQGESEAAEQLFRDVVALDIPFETLPTTTLVAVGAAWGELGTPDKAEQYLKAALERPDIEPLFRIVCLRDMATLALDAGRARESLERLSTARALITMHLPEKCLFRTTLAEQRGRALYMAREYEQALTEFHSVVQAIAGQDDKLRLQPLEGMARAALALGRADVALPAAEECAMLYEQLFPEALESLGRVYLLLGQACDQAGHAARAAEAYGKAASVLPQDHGDRVVALMSQAHSLSQAQRWEEALQVWEAALPLLPAEDAARRAKVAAQITQCRKKINEAKAPARPRTRRPATPRRAR